MNASTTPARELLPVVAICADHDADCDHVENKVGCWLYDPARGFCPFLRSNLPPQKPEAA